MNLFEFISQAWAIAEPLLALVSLAITVKIWSQTKIAKKKKYANEGGKDYIIALQVGRPVSEAVKAYFGELDTLIDVNLVLGRPMLVTDEDYKKLATEVYSAIAQNQNCKIKLVLSGPIGLSALIGMLIGLHHFNVEIYQFDPQEGYKKLPEPDRSWLNHNGRAL